MKILFRTLLVLLGIALLWWAVEMIASETGEVVVLTITAPDGSAGETRLWVVDHDGSAWLRAGHAGSGWYQELVAAPTVTVERGGNVQRFLAATEMDALATINEEMRRKYGWRDAYISFFFPRDNAVPIRLGATKPTAD